MHDGPAPPSFGKAWLCLTATVAIHVADEAATGFLALYNPTVLGIRDRLPWLPLPVLTFRVWLAGLAAAIVALLLLARWAYANARLLRPLAYVFAILMIGNGLLHLAASVYLGRLVPGVASAPLLLVASAYLLISLRRSSDRSGRPT